MTLKIATNMIINYILWYINADYWCGASTVYVDILCLLYFWLKSLYNTLHIFSYQLHQVMQLSNGLWQTVQLVVAGIKDSQG